MPVGGGGSSGDVSQMLHHYLDSASPRWSPGAEPGNKHAFQRAPKNALACPVKVNDGLYLPMYIWSMFLHVHGCLPSNTRDQERLRRGRNRQCNVNSVIKTDYC